MVAVVQPVENVGGNGRGDGRAAIDSFNRFSFDPPKLFLVPAGFKKDFLHQGQGGVKIAFQAGNFHTDSFFGCKHGYGGAQGIDSFFQFHRRLADGAFHHHVRNQVGQANFVRGVQQHAATDTNAKIDQWQFIVVGPEQGHVTGVVVAPDHRRIKVGLWTLVRFYRTVKDRGNFGHFQLARTDCFFHIFHDLLFLDRKQF